MQVRSQAQVVRPFVKARCYGRETNVNRKTQGKLDKFLPW
jgi:hypothetical protein